MLTDLSHNKIVKDTMTDGFARSVENNLIPKLKYVFGDALLGVRMYEDYLSDGFLCEGQWYYPLTVLTPDGALTRWISWTVDGGNFKDCLPYSYVGEEDLDFKLAEDVPEQFRLKLVGRAITYEDGVIPVRVHAVDVSPRDLSGKYSQTFVDELARQITEEITDKLGVEGLSGSSLELELVFAPGTYMEHTSENVTYRRLLMTGRGCRARDFWVKWERLDAAVGYSIADPVSRNSVKFTLGEDVTQKIREKEYRFLCGSNPQKYQSAMGKKTVTEWRELIKTALKRGELTKLPVAEEDNGSIAEVDDKLRRMLLSMGVKPAESTSDMQDTRQADDASTMSELERVAFGIGADDEESSGEYPEEYREDELSTVGAPVQIAAAEPADKAEFEWDGNGEFSLPDGEVELSEEDEKTLAEQALLDADSEYEPALTLTADNFDVPEEEKVAAESENQSAFDREEEERLREARIRAELEVKIRRELEAEARAKAEEEQRKIQQENDRLVRENERLSALARQAEERRAREEEARRLEAERIAREREERKKAEEEERRREQQRYLLEEQERRRLAETARLAVEEQRRLEAEKAEREARAKAEAERLERERLAREEARRIAEKKEAEQKAIAESLPKPVEYISKYLVLRFARVFDMNVLKRIKEIVEETILAEGKSDVRIQMKAYPVDSYTVNLDVTKIPKTEERLLLAIVHALGNARIGISKIVVE